MKTPVLRLAAAVHYVPKHTDARKRAMTIEDLLTMQSGLAWKESGYAYEPGSGNDVMAMFTTNDWTNYVIDRPMAAQPGTTFVYNSGASHLVSGGGLGPDAPPRRERSPRSSSSRRSAFASTSGSAIRTASAPEGSACCCSRATSPSSPSSTSTTGAGTAARSSPPPGSSSRPTDHVADPLHEYGYLWWLDRADGYAYMAGLYGQTRRRRSRRRTSSP